MKEISQETKPASNIILDLLSLELWENKFPLLMPLRIPYSILFCQP